MYVHLQFKDGKAKANTKTLLIDPVNLRVWQINKPADKYMLVTNLA